MPPTINSDLLILASTDVMLPGAFFRSMPATHKTLPFQDPHNTHEISKKILLSRAPFRCFPFCFLSRTGSALMGFLPLNQKYVKYKEKLMAKVTSGTTDPTNTPTFSPSPKRYERATDVTEMLLCFYILKRIFIHALFCLFTFTKTLQNGKKLFNKFLFCFYQILTSDSFIFLKIFIKTRQRLTNVVIDPICSIQDRTNWEFLIYIIKLFNLNLSFQIGNKIEIFYYYTNSIIVIQRYLI